MPPFEKVKTVAPARSASDAGPASARLILMGRTASSTASAAAAILDIVFVISVLL